MTSVSRGRRKTPSSPGAWLVLIHRLPPRPAYLRVKVGRLLDRVGAVAVKNAVYVLPRSDDAQEDFQWIVKQVLQEGGEATVFEARFVDGLNDAQVERLFRDARDRDYRELTRQARTAGSDPARLRRRLDEVAALDFFRAPARRDAERALAALESRRRDPASAMPPVAMQARDLVGRTWVTRKDVHVDRMACAWLIRRFIDPRARFRFVDGKTHAPRDGEVRFDMFEGEFTHEGDKCSFEVFVDRLKLQDPALRALSEIVHDIDLKDDKYGRPETAGIASVIRSIAHAHASDAARIERASAVLDDLRVYLKAARP